MQKGKHKTVEPRLKRIFVPEEERSLSRIDNIIRHCLLARARNEELGNAIYYEMFETLFGNRDRRLELRSGFRYDIRIAKMPKTKDVVLSKDYLHVGMHVQYKKTLRDNIFMIGCASSHSQLNALFKDPRCEYRWLLNDGGNLSGKRDFTVERVRIDNEDVPIIETKSTKRGYEVWCGSDRLKKKINQDVKLEMDISTKQARQKRTFPVYLVYPVRGLEIKFDYANAGIKNVREESFFAGKHPQPSVTGKKGKSIAVKISDEEWIFPTSGVIFIWDD